MSGHARMLVHGCLPIPVCIAMSACTVKKGGLAKMMGVVRGSLTFRILHNSAHPYSVALEWACKDDGGCAR